ncbi:hypothetical protein LguiA_034423 [Lonicera macranthoides]
MAFSSLSSTLTSSSLYPSLISFAHTFNSFHRKANAVAVVQLRPSQRRRTNKCLSIKALTLDFSGSFFEGDFDGDDDGDDDGEDDSLFSGLASAADEDREEIQCPPGLRQYETMAVLRPDMSEDERLALTQKYEELLVAGGGMYVEVFNRGVIPLAYDIKKRNRAGEKNTYLDGIFLMFTFFTKPESIQVLEETFITDDNVIRTSTFKVRKRKY